MKIFSVGYAAFTFDKFLEILKVYEVATLVDVRSIPYSKISPMFSKKSLKVILPKNDIHYLYIGHLLGGKANPPYPERMKTEEFKQGLDKIENITEQPVALMCLEPAEEKCHRQFITNALRERGHKIIPLLPPRKKKNTSFKQTSLEDFLK